MEEKISLTAGRDGGLQNLEVHGFLMLRITDDTFGRVKIDVTNNDSKGIQIQVRGHRLVHEDACSHSFVSSHVHCVKKLLLVITFKFELYL